MIKNKLFKVVTVHKFMAKITDQNRYPHQYTIMFCPGFSSDTTDMPMKCNAMSVCHFVNLVPSRNIYNHCLWGVEVKP